jgi:hypothetical protein
MLIGNETLLFPHLDSVHTVLLSSSGTAASAVKDDTLQIKFSRLICGSGVNSDFSIENGAREANLCIMR